MAQQKYPVGYFLNPLDMPITLSGNFGEIRNNHFHSGIDIRTGGKEGLPVLASAGGYISRIKVSPFGYGNALYLTHENGYVSVYGHLSCFDSAIEAWVKEKQYEKQAFELDLFPLKNQFVFAQCDTLGLSGNSGGSEGPHLHFEIREEKSEMPVNPLLFGLPVDDTLAPVVASILVYPAREGATVNGSLSPVRLPVRPAPKSLLQQGIHGITDTVVSADMLKFSVETWDCELNSDSKNGVFSLILLADGTQIFGSLMEKFAFENTKYVNAHIDFHERKVHKRNYIRTHFLPNNKAGIYLPSFRGYAGAPEPGEIRIMEFRVQDAPGHSFVVQLPWKGSEMPSKLELPETRVEDDTLAAAFTGEGPPKEWEWNHDHWYESGDFHLHVPAGALYDNILFRFSRSKGPAGAHSPVFHIFREDVPLHKPVVVEILAKKIGSAYHNKVVLARLDNKSRVQNAIAATYQKDWFQAKISQFGKYTLMIDSVPPVIVQMNLIKGKPSLRDSCLVFKISDKLSGIDKYRGSIDGKWVLMKYDAKSGLLRYEFDEHLPRTGKKHQLVLLVSDHSGNKQVKTFGFVY